MHSAQQAHHEASPERRQSTNRKRKHINEGVTIVPSSSSSASSTIDTSTTTCAYTSVAQTESMKGRHCNEKKIPFLAKHVPSPAPCRAPVCLRPESKPHSSAAPHTTIPHQAERTRSKTCSRPSPAIKQGPRQGRSSSRRTPSIPRRSPHPRLVVGPLLPASKSNDKVDRLQGAHQEFLDETRGHDWW